MGVWTGLAWLGDEPVAGSLNAVMQQEEGLCTRYPLTDTCRFTEAVSCPGNTDELSVRTLHLLNFAVPSRLMLLVHNV
jgi:hypothetical protein